MDLLKPPPPLKLTPLQRITALGPVGVFGVVFAVYLIVGILFSNHNQRTDLLIEAVGQFMFLTTAAITGVWFIIAPQAGSRKRLEEKHPDHQTWQEITDPHKVPQFTVAVEELEPKEKDGCKQVEVCLVEKRNYSLKVLTHQAFKGNDPDTVEEALDYKIGLEKEAERRNLEVRQAYIERRELNKETENLYKLLSNN